MIFVVEDVERMILQHVLDEEPTRAIHLRLVSRSWERMSQECLSAIIDDLSDYLRAVRIRVADTRLKERKFLFRYLMSLTQAADASPSLYACARCGRLNEGILTCACQHEERAMRRRVLNSAIGPAIAAVFTLGLFAMQAK